MADWADSSPNEATAYVTVLSNLRDRDKDAAKMFSSAPTNPAENFMRFNRSTNLFQEYLSAVWTDKVLAIAGGGTGAITASAARTALGIGTMGVQNSNSVTITGGSISSGASIDAAALTSGLVAQARLGSGSDGAGLKALLDNQTYGVLAPVGSGNLWFTNTPPSGFLICDGTAISRTTYSALFAIIGETYGVGDGATTFNLPDLRQRIPMGKAASGTGSTLAGTFGDIDHTHTGPSHTHDAGTLLGPAHTHGAGSYTTGTHSHTFSDTSSTPSTSTSWGTNAGAGGAAASSTHTHTVSGTTNTQPAMAISGTSASSGTGSVTGSTAAGGTGNTGTGNPPILVINYIIKY